MTSQEFFAFILRMEAEATQIKQELRPHLEADVPENQLRQIYQRFDEATGVLSAVAEIRAFAMKGKKQ